MPKLHLLKVKNADNTQMYEQWESFQGENF